MHFTRTRGLLLVVVFASALSFPVLSGAATVVTPITITPPGYCPSITATLRAGAQGSQVLALQKFLAEYYQVSSTRIGTGYFGATTQGYVTRFQKEKGIPATGTVNTTTADTIRSVCPKSQPPTLVSIRPSLGEAGTKVVLTGKNFTATGNTINIGSNVYQGQTSANGTSISFVIPAYTSPACFFTSPPCAIATMRLLPGPYKLSVTNKNGTSGAQVFTVLNVQTSPTILTVTPSAGPVGTQIFIKGRNFLKSGNTVFFGGSVYPNHPSTNDGALISFIIPTFTSPACLFITPSCEAPQMLLKPGIYDISVKGETIRESTSSNKVSFTVTASAVTGAAPIVKEISPSSGPADTKVVIRGANFTATNNTVSFGDSVYPGHSSSDGATIMFTIPSYTSPACLFITPSCEAPQMLLKPGGYKVSVTNAHGRSDSVPFTLGSVVSKDTPPESCKVWFDGCNTCSRSSAGESMICTLMACYRENSDAATCREYFSESRN